MKRIVNILIFVICICIIANAQENIYPNNSFISSYWFTGNCGDVGLICSTYDGGYAFISGLAAKEEKDNHIFINICCSSCTPIDDYKAGGIILYKANKQGKLEWAKYLCEWGQNGQRAVADIKQTTDYGFIIAYNGQIIKTNKTGDKQWAFLTEKDSIPDIKKSKFLTQCCISSITECRDGGFIALIDASFSLLKISKDGKPLWLKSTVFDEFSPIYREYFSYQDSAFINADTLYINQFVWQQGGGAYIPTYNVFETDDGGYMAIGQNMYRDTNNITLYKKGDPVMNKIFCIDSSKKKIRIYPEKLYGIRNFALNHPLKDEEKIITAKKYTTVVVKTDKDGNVLWTKQFGDMSYDTRPHSDLIKLANGKWLVRIRDCDSTGLDNWRHVKYGPAHSEFYIIDDEGNTIKEPHFGPSDYSCDPWGMSLAPDSGYYFYEQDIVSKADKKFCIQWQKGFGGSLTDVGTHAVTADTGVLSTENGVIYKFDKYGNKPSDKLSIRAVRDDSTTVHLYLEMKDSSVCSSPAKWDDANIVVRIKDFRDSTTTVPSV